MNRRRSGPSEETGPVKYQTRRMAEAERNAVVDGLEGFRSVTISSGGWLDIMRLTRGDYAPFGGFAGEVDYRSVVGTGRLDEGAAPGISPLLTLDEEDASDVEIADKIILRDVDGKNIALIHLSEKFRIDRKLLEDLFKRAGEPGRALTGALADGGDIAVAGDIYIISSQFGTEAHIPAGEALPVSGLQTPESGGSRNR